MVMPGTKGMNYADWAGEVDFVANDHYVVPHPQARDELSFSANLTSNIAGGRPWFPDGALHQRRELAARQPGQAAG